MAERRQDKLLYIRTTGIREWKDPKVRYNRCESTPYIALDKLFESYKINKNHKIVDFGCGKGRVVFYIHHRFKVPITGIEVNDKTYDEAINNKESYRFREKHIEAPIKFEYGLAEHYKIKPDDNLFYFFNPFSVHIFKKVIKNILNSVEEHNRTIDIILYYPMPEYKEFMKKKTPFILLNKIRVPDINDNRAKFLIYRYTKKKVSKP